MAVAALFALPFGALAATSPTLAVAGLLGLAFVALALYDVAAGLAAFVVLALMEQAPPVAGSPVIKLAGAFLVLLLVRKQLRILRLVQYRPGVALVAVLFCAWAGASAFWAQDPDAAVASAARFALGAIFLFAVYGAVRDRRHLVWLAYSFVLGALVTAVLGRAGPAPLEGETSRLAGGVGNPNELASIIVAALALAAFGVAGTRRRSAQVFLGVSFCVLLFALFATGSRGGLVALVVAVFAAVALARPARRRAIGVVAIALASALFYYALIAPPELRQHVTGFTEEGGAGRKDLWLVAASVATDNPVLGAGAGNFRIVEASFAAEAINLSQIRFIVDSPQVAHNMFLGISADLGVVGLFLFLLLLGAVFSSALRAVGAASRLDDRELEFLGRGVVVALIGVLVTAMFGSFEYEKHLWLLLGMATALSAVAPLGAQQRMETSMSLEET
jgi:putative inorganic carbon (HCO3(-)) transporter